MEHLPLEPVVVGHGPGELLLRGALVEGDDVGEGAHQMEAPAQGQGQAGRRDASQEVQGTNGAQVLLPEKRWVVTV